MYLIFKKLVKLRCKNSHNDKIVKKKYLKIDSLEQFSFNNSKKLFMCNTHDEALTVVKKLPDDNYHIELLDFKYAVL